jgi:hypothetical protein
MGFVKQIVQAGAQPFPIRASKKAGLKSLMQNCLREIGKRQGTASVVPPMARCKSGFSRCCIANRLNITTGAKAHSSFRRICGTTEVVP